jgi:hypothetical protein
MIQITYSLSPSIHGRPPISPLPFPAIGGDKSPKGIAFLFIYGAYSFDKLSKRDQNLAQNGVSLIPLSQNVLKIQYF